MHHLDLVINNAKAGQWLCGSVGRAVASDTRCPRFESSHRQKFIYNEHLFIVNCQLCIEKTKIKKKEAGNGPFKKNNAKAVIYLDWLWRKG